MSRLFPKEVKLFLFKLIFPGKRTVARMIEQARSDLGGLDGMVLVVGIFGNTGLAELRVKEDWDDILAANLRGPMLCCREGLDKLENGSSIVFISSISAIRAGSRLVSYDASKAGLAGLMRHVAFEGSRRGIRANIVMPGMVDTPNGRVGRCGSRFSCRQYRQDPFWTSSNGLGNRLCGLVFSLRRKRLYHGPNTGR